MLTRYRIGCTCCKQVKTDWTLSLDSVLRLAAHDGFITIRNKFVCNACSKKDINNHKETTK